MIENEPPGIFSKGSELTTHFYLRGAKRWIPYDGYGPRNLHTLPGCLAPAPPMIRPEWLKCDHSGAKMVLGGWKCECGATRRGVR